MKKVKAMSSGRIWESKNPWYRHYLSAKQRCERKDRLHYKYYGGRGIKFLMTLSEFEKIWFRDSAYKMKRPSIDRINSNGNYILKNCRFLELSENSLRADRTKSGLCKKIIQISKDGKFKKIWGGVNIAKRGTGFNNIHSVLNGTMKTCGGYKWGYFNEK